MKIYKAMSYKNVLSKSLPKHLKDKNKYFSPLKIKSLLLIPKKT